MRRYNKNAYKNRDSKKRPFYKLKLIIYMIFTILTTLITFIFYKLDERIFPSVAAISDMTVTTQINAAVNNSVAKITQEKNLSSENFYSSVSDESGKINSFTVNTILVNEICNHVALDISESLNSIGTQKINIPLGATLGVELLAALGPTFTISIYPMGSATVDYSTKFDAIGINQTNFQVWLSIESNVQIVNPLQNYKLSVSRNVPLVNTIITGEVPSVFFNAKP